MVDVRCPVCNSSFVIGNGSVPTTELKDGIHYLVPQTIRNENKVTSRLNTLREAGVDVEKLQNLMQSNDSIKDIFNEDDPILETIGRHGFLRNPELFRRWITAQTFRLLKDPLGWTHAARKRYDIKYAFKQTKKELELLCKLYKKNPNDRRFSFFSLGSLKVIFSELTVSNRYTEDFETRINFRQTIKDAVTYEELLSVINSKKWQFNKYAKVPVEWLNCFKGAGAYYTLQNIIRTHEMVLPNCNNMSESLAKVEELYSKIMSYTPTNRRWDLMLSLLVSSVKATHFELKY